MHGAAQRQGAAGPDLEGAHAAALAEIGPLLRRLRRDPACDRTVTELVELEMRLAEVRAAYDAERFCRESLATVPVPPCPCSQPARDQARRPLLNIVRDAAAPKV